MIVSAEERPLTRKPAGKPHNHSARDRLVALLAHVHFGRILDLHVRNRQPVFEDPAPNVIRTVKLSGISQPPPSTAAVALRREVADLFGLLDALDDGVIGRIEIAHGVPLFIEVHEGPIA